MGLHVWSIDKGEEYVIAESKEDAMAIIRDLKYEDPDDMAELPDDKTMTLFDEDAREKITRTCTEWCAIAGRGYFCSPNF